MTQVFSTARWLYDAAIEQTARVLEPQPMAKGDAFILMATLAVILAGASLAVIEIVQHRPTAWGAAAVMMSMWMALAWWVARAVSLVRARDMSDQVAEWLREMTEACEGDVSDALFAKLEKLHRDTQDAMDQQLGLYRCQSQYVQRTIASMVAQSRNECADSAVIEFWRRRGLTAEQYQAQIEEAAFRAEQEEQQRQAVLAEREAAAQAAAAARKQRAASKTAPAPALAPAPTLPSPAPPAPLHREQPLPAAVVDPMDAEMED